MFNQIFDEIYLINLPTRQDRLILSEEECNRQNIKFKRVDAIDGGSIDNFKSYGEEEDSKMRWNKYASALVQTTASIVENALEMKYESILILEDDIEFNHDVGEVLKSQFSNVPSDWEMFYFGISHIKPYKMISNYIARVNAGYCCHAYAIKKNTFSKYLQLLREIDKPIDHITMNDFQPNGRSYCFIPNMAYQREGFSDIEKKNIFHYYLK